MIYDPKKIEGKWQKAWDKSGIYRAKDVSKKPKWYSLIEFPYPSGDGLHTGHIRSNTAMDIISRKRRMEGYNVLYPIGWDAFGLPTENYAIKTGVHPAKVTKQNTDTFRRQLKAVGFSFDWSREINTTDPDYYRFTQWIFLQLFKKGLAYKQKSLVNWCPKDKTGLANEEVVNGCCERCGTAVEKKEKEQWMLKITAYADRLDKDLDTVDYLPQIKLQQRNWIGRSEGAEIPFLLNFTKNPADNEHRGPGGERAQLTVFTTRPDTLFGATYLVLSPEHLWVTLATDADHDVLANKEEVKAYVAAVRNKTEIERTAADKEKTGIRLEGVEAIHPATGEALPIFVADYVLASYGTGAIMAVPAHDERDHAFAEKYDLPIRQVIEPKFIGESGEGAIKPDLPFIKREAVCAIVRNPHDDRYLCISWKGLHMHGLVTGGIEAGEDIVECARREVLEETGYANLRHITTAPVAINTYFYHRVKQQNRHAHFRFVFFDLENEEQIPVDEKEAALHEIVWKKKAELKDFFSVFEGQFLVSLLNNSNYLYTGEGLMLNSAEFSDLDSAVAKEAITKRFGTPKTSYKLRDWVFSRQRYWGEPIPLVHCDHCAQTNSVQGGWVAIPEKDLPVKLPTVKDYQPSDDGESPLARVPKWVNTKCPVCKGRATRETDTMPNWAGSSWYFLRYVDPKNKKSLASMEKLKYWMGETGLPRSEAHPATGVDWYNGGMEHTTLHLLYSRFWNKFLYDIGMVPVEEPYQKRTAHGMILGEGGVKMSKSKGNVVNPDLIVKNYGADTLRIYEMFMGPFDQAITWNTESIIGSRRFLDKIWALSQKVGKNKDDKEFAVLTNKTIKKVTEDIESMAFNTAISAMMVWSNEADKLAIVPVGHFEVFLKLLAPFAPHLTEELWQILGHRKSIHLEKWPEHDPTQLVDELVIVAVQVNGRVRHTLNVNRIATEEDVKKMALNNDIIKKWIDNQPIKKIIYVPGKIVNIVV